MAKRNTSLNQTSETIELKEPLETPAQEVEAEATKIEEPVKEEAPVKSTEPVHVELKTSETQNTLSPATSKESIQASIQEKLSRKTDEGAEDPFVPSTQLQNEVKEIAKNGGFPLSRGTEVGARLMARSKRIS